ncbi:hypothetical protein HJFPF1_10612 [Paramyrothecium foliicola]|nr:hypothetical protein HJFPF1_10612 [Paramyrothecium foliicola]
MLHDLPSAATIETLQDKEKADPNVWQLYPLTTLENVRAWQNHTATPDPTGKRQAQTSPTPDETLRLEEEEEEEEQPELMSLASECSHSPSEAQTQVDGDSSLFPADESSAAPTLVAHADNRHLALGSVAESAEDDGARQDAPRSSFISAEFEREFLW